MPAARVVDDVQNGRRGVEQAAELIVDGVRRQHRRACRPDDRDDEEGPSQDARHGIFLYAEVDRRPWLFTR
jgi:hypothetical protein